MNKTEIKEVLNLLYRLEEIHAYDDAENGLGTLIGTQIDKLHNQLN